MKRHLLYVIFLVSVPCVAQSKYYIAGNLMGVVPSGANLLLATGYSFAPKFYCFDFEYQRRIVGSLNAVAGLSYFNAGYNVSEGTFSSMSQFKSSFAAVPLMARWNPGNKNFYLLDFGVVPYYLLKAHLKEGVTRFNSLRTVEGDITKYSNRFYFGYKVQMLVLINRFYVGFFLFAPFHGQSSLKGLESHWGLNAQQSTYLLSDGFRDFTTYGLKAGVRIR